MLAGAETDVKTWGLKEKTLSVEAGEKVQNCRKMI
jgi:hypothetical protein